MTHDKQPVTLTEGCFGVTRGGEGVPQEVVPVSLRPDAYGAWQFAHMEGGASKMAYSIDGSACGEAWPQDDEPEFDIIAVFPDRAAAEAYLRGEPEGKRDRGKMVKPLPGAPCGGYPGEPEGKTLAPCPLCGGEAALSVTEGAHMEAWTEVRCGRPQCGAAIETQGSGPNEASHVIDTWNRRATPTPDPAQAGVGMDAKLLELSLAASDVVAWFDLCRPDISGPRIKRLRYALAAFPTIAAAKGGQP